MKNTILLAGGAGYIGSHTCIELINKGYNVVIVDCHYNSNPIVYDRLKTILGKEIKHYNVDVCNEEELDIVFKENSIDVVIDFAGYKAVGESVKKPMLYYENNLKSTFSLLNVMKKNNVNNIIFSSSATVYGMNNISPMEEDMPLGPCTNPYGWTKFMNEKILIDIANADKSLSVVLLRYFNPVGAHESGLIGEDPTDIPNNLMPYISQVAAGRREILSVYGNDYDTHDGTGVRDYIHVVDLAKAHALSVGYILENTGVEVFNIGTGIGYSVLDMVNSFIKVNNVDIPYKIVGRRDGDIGTCYADSSKANSILGWKAEKNIDDMCRDSWNWQKNNPYGYKSMK